VSGVAVACGPAITRFKAGDSGFAMPGIGRGGYADHVMVREEEAAARGPPAGKVVLTVS
jgi:NADPH:quinone reductase-like Zn-dependent oxidoreductase